MLYKRMNIPLRWDKLPTGSNLPDFMRRHFSNVHRVTFLSIEDALHRFVELFPLLPHCHEYTVENAKNVLGSDEKIFPPEAMVKFLTENLVQSTVDEEHYWKKKITISTRDEPNYEDLRKFMDILQKVTF